MTMPASRHGCPGCGVHLPSGHICGKCLARLPRDIRRQVVLADLGRKRRQAQVHNAITRAEHWLKDNPYRPTGGSRG